MGKPTSCVKVKTQKNLNQRGACKTFPQVKEGPSYLSSGEGKS